MDQAEGLRQLKQNGVPFMDEHATKALKITAVTGGKGGVGKSNIALNLGLSLVELGEKVCVLDADFGLANIDVLLGVKPRFHIGHVLNHSHTLEEILVQGPEGLTFIPASSGLKHLAGLSPEALQPFLEQAKQLGQHFDRLIIDTPAGISGDVMTFLRSSGEILVIVTPEPTSLTDAYALIKLVRMENRSLPVKVLMNMCESADEGYRIGRQLEKICLNFLGFQPEVIGVVERDPLVVRAIRRQKPFVQAFPQSVATRQVRQLARRLRQNKVVPSDLGDFFATMKDLLS